MVFYTSYMFWLSTLIILVLVAINGLIAGLTLGLLSMDETKIQVLMNSGTDKQKRAASRIKPLRKNPHLLLVTLLLGSTIINETLPILLDNLFNGSSQWLAIIVSTVLVLIFAEILPQALCTHYGLQIGSYFYWFVYIVKFLTFPIAWPIAKFLDYILGKETGALYKKAELKEFVTLHGESHGGDLSPDEVKIVQGTLSLHSKSIEKVMTKLERVFMLEKSLFINNTVLQNIAQSGHSRIPIFDKNPENIIGIMLVKNLILLDDSVSTYISDLDLIKAPIMKTNTNLFDAINFFQQGASHLAIIENLDSDVVGICTLEDIIEEVLMEEVLDESDQWTDNTHTSRVVRIPRSARKQFIQAKIIPPGKIELILENYSSSSASGSGSSQ